MAKPVFIINAANNNGSGATTVSASATFAAELNDVVLLSLTINQTTSGEDAYTSFSYPTGFTQVSGSFIENKGANLHTVFVLARCTTASASSEKTFTANILSRKAALHISVWRGVNTTTSPVVIGNLFNGNTNTVAAIGPTGLNVDDLLYHVVAAEGVRTVSSVSTGFTGLALSSSSGGGGDATKVTITAEYLNDGVDSKVGNLILSAAADVNAWMIRVKTANPVTSQNLTRTASDTLTAISDAVNGVKSLLRNTFDGLTTYHSYVLKQNPVAYWRMNEASGALKNSVPNSPDTSTVNSTPTYGVSGPITNETAIQFDGTDDWFAANHHAALNLGDVFSIAVWYKPTATAHTDDRILGKGAGAYAIRFFGVDNAYLDRPFNGSVVRQTTLLTDTNRWYFLVFTKNGATAKAYTDAVDETVGVGTQTFTDNTSVFRIGADPSDGGDVAGQIAHVALFNYELTSSQITEMWNARTVAITGDSIVRTIIAVIARTASDTITSVTDGITRIANKVRTTSESLTISDSISRINNKLRTAVDTITTVTDSVVRAAASKLRTAADTVVTSESASRVVSLFRLASDAVVTSDAVNGVKNLIRAAADTLAAISDSVGRAITALRTGTDTISISDSLTRQAIAFARSASESLTISDSISRIANKIRTAADTVTAATDSLARGAIAFVRSVSDAIVTSDAVVRVVTVYRTVADSLSAITDTVARSLISVRTTVDLTATTDALVRVITALRIAGDTLPAITDDVIRSAALKIRSITDSVVTSDAIERIVSVVRSVTDAITAVTDSISHQIITGAQQLYRTASDTIVIGEDAVARVVIAIRTTLDTTTVSDAVVRISNFIRFVADTTVVTDSVSRLLSIVRSAIDSTFISDSVARVTTVVRSASDALDAITDTVNRLVVRFRTATDTTSVTDLVARQWQGVRNAIDTLPEIADQISTNLAVILYRTAVDTITIGTDIAQRLVSSVRAAGDSLLTSDTIERMLVYARTASDTINFVGDSLVRSSIAFGRSVADAVVTLDVVTILVGAPKYVGEYIKAVLRPNRFRVGQNDAESSVGGGVNRIRISDSNNRKRVD